MTTDPTPEERAGLQQCGEDDYGVPYFRLDADRLAELVRERDEAVEALRVARFVADHWRIGMLASDTPSAAHPLCMVLAALDGATDPVDCGIDPAEHEAFLTALGEVPK